VAASTPVFAQSRTPVIEPDRPDLTNSVNTVEPGLFQIEFGAAYTRDGSARTVGLPLTGRFGVTNRFELRIDATSVESEVAENVRTTGIGDIAAGVKLRLWYGRGGLPPSSLEPAINIPAKSSHKGLMFDDPDYTVTWLTGLDVGSRAHVDVNYRIGAIGEGRGSARFTQHAASISTSFTTAENWSPYVEVYWISRQESDGTAVSAIDTGVIRTITPRLAVDAGVQLGVSHAAPALALFGGVSTIIGHRRSIGAFRPAPGRD
jgi:outer membrane putative beta-barrel porin/alpha-amylase